MGIEEGKLTRSHKKRGTTYLNLKKKMRKFLGTGRDRVERLVISRDMKQ